MFNFSPPARAVCGPDLAAGPWQAGTALALALAPAALALLQLLGHRGYEGPYDGAFMENLAIRSDCPAEIIQKSGCPVAS